MVLFGPKEKMERVESEKEKAVLLCLYNNSQRNIRDMVNEMPKNYGNSVSIQGTANIIDKYVELGIVKVSSSSKSKYSVDRNKVHIKSFDMVILGQTLTPAILALFFICFPVAFIFGISSIFIAIGGVLVFIPQMAYTIYKILKTPEHKEIYVSTLGKKIDTSKWIDKKDIPQETLSTG